MSLTPTSPFSYQCNRCGRCCEGKLIPINPYERLRAARSLGMTAKQFETHHTQGEGMFLAHREGTRQCALYDNGCTVHADRPLACRLYPLGRTELASGDISYKRIQPHPASLGVFGENGTVGDYISTQDIDAYISARLLYRELHFAMARALADHVEDEDAPVDWFDIEHFARDECSRRGVDMPIDPLSVAALHVEGVQERLRKTRGTSSRVDS